MHCIYSFTSWNIFNHFCILVNRNNIIFTFPCNFFCTQTYLSLMDTCTDIELYSQIEIWAWTFSKTSRLFFIAAAAFHIITISVGQLQHPQLLTNTLWFLFFIFLNIITQVGVKWYLLIALIFLYIMTNDIKEFFSLNIAICIFPVLKDLFRNFPYIITGIYLSLVQLFEFFLRFPSYQIFVR